MRCTAEALFIIVLLSVGVPSSDEKHWKNDFKDEEDMIDYERDLNLAEGLVNLEVKQRQGGVLGAQFQPNVKEPKRNQQLQVILPETKETENQDELEAKVIGNDQRLNKIREDPDMKLHDQLQYLVKENNYPQGKMGETQGIEVHDQPHPMLSEEVDLLRKFLEPSNNHEMKVDDRGQIKEKESTLKLQQSERNDRKFNTKSTIKIKINENQVSNFEGTAAILWTRMKGEKAAKMKESLKRTVSDGGSNGSRKFSTVVSRRLSQARKSFSGSLKKIPLLKELGRQITSGRKERAYGVQDAQSPGSEEYYGKFGGSESDNSPVPRGLRPNQMVIVNPSASPYSTSSKNASPKTPKTPYPKTLYPSELLHPNKPGRQRSPPSSPPSPFELPPAALSLPPEEFEAFQAQLMSGEAYERSVSPQRSPSSNQDRLSKDLP